MNGLFLRQILAMDDEYLIPTCDFLHRQCLTRYCIWYRKRVLFHVFDYIGYCHWWSDSSIIAKAGLQRWLGQVIEVIELSAVAQESALLVDLKYRVRGEDEVREERRSVPFAGGAF